MNIRSGDKLPKLLVIGIVLVLIGAIVSLIITQMKPRVNVKVGDGIFTARVVTDRDDLDKGLGGVNELNPNEAMLFVFEKDNKWPIWMKEMKIPIDIIWLDVDKTVVYMVKGAQPDSYPGEKFIPNDAARYVLEATAGTVDSRNIRIGSKAEFNLADLKEWWQ